MRRTLTSIQRRLIARRQGFVSFPHQWGRVGLPAYINPLRTSFGPSSSYRSEEHTSELQSLMRISYAVFCLKKKKPNTTKQTSNQNTENNTYTTNNTTLYNY